MVIDQAALRPKVVRDRRSMEQCAPSDTRRQECGGIRGSNHTLALQLSSHSSIGRCWMRVHKGL